MTLAFLIWLNHSRGNWRRTLRSIDETLRWNDHTGDNVYWGKKGCKIFLSGHQLSSIPTGSRELILNGGVLSIRVHLNLIFVFSKILHYGYLCKHSRFWKFKLAVFRKSRIFGWAKEQFFVSFHWYRGIFQTSLSTGDK